MMRAQRNFVKDEMAYLHRKMREQLTKDSTVLAKVMQETHDKREIEVKQLRAENKKSAIDLALHISDFQMYQRRHAVPSGAEELAQCQKNLREAQIQSLRKDDEIAALDLHIHMLKGLMATHGMLVPPDASQSVATPAPTVVNAPTWGNTNAPPVVDLNNNGWGTNPLLLQIRRATIYIPMKAWTPTSMGRTLTTRVTKADPTKDQETNRTIPLTPKESEDVTRMKRTSVNAKSSKRLGTLMVRPLQKIGLSLC
jgi:hypothetical protein